MTSADEPVVALDERDDVLWVTMSRPPANALGGVLVDGLTAAVDRFETGTAKVMVIASALDGVFAAGADIKQMASMTTTEFADYRDALRDPLERLATCGRPSIAAIDGLALGGGLELAMACTLRFATRASQLGLPEIKLGLIPGAGGTQRLPLLVGRGRALEIMLSGRSLEGEEAARIGLVDLLVDSDVEDGAGEFAARLARRSAPAAAAILACVEATVTGFACGMAIEGDAVASLFDDGEAREGLAAFVDKRAPVFS